MPRALDAAAGVLNASVSVLCTASMSAVGGGTMCAVTLVEPGVCVRMMSSGRTPWPIICARAALYASSSKLDAFPAITAVKVTAGTIG